MPQLFSNNARALLVAGITDTATSLTIESAKADFFPVANVGSGSLPSNNNWFKAVLQDSSGNIEIIYVRTRASGSGVMSNVLRGQEGTSARAYIAGSVVGLRLTAADINSTVDLVSKNNTFTGTNTFTGSNTFSGVATFSQTIVGSINGNAATVTNGVYTSGDQTISGNKNFTSTALRIGGTAIGSNEVYLYESAANAFAIRTGSSGAGYKYFGLSASGDMTVQGAVVATGDVTAFSDERLKHNWRDFDDHFLSDLASVKVGIFDRKDTGETQVGVGAQSLQGILPQAVRQGADGYLSVAYGNAALAATVVLARRILALEAKLGE